MYKWAFLQLYIYDARQYQNLDLNIWKECEKHIRIVYESLKR